LIQLQSLRSHIGTSFSVKVTGAAGRVRGSDVYTDDSAISAAAVHAGLLRMGEKGYVTVTIMPPQSEYPSTEQNGVKSMAAGAYQGSFSLSRSSQR
jgi:hypothetical protein